MDELIELIRSSPDLANLMASLSQMMLNVIAGNVSSSYTRFHVGGGKSVFIGAFTIKDSDFKNLKEGEITDAVESGLKKALKAAAKKSEVS